MHPSSTLALVIAGVQLFLPNSSAFVTSPAALQARTSPAVGTRGGPGTALSMSQEITPKLAKYLDKFNKLMEADEICPEAKMNEVRILRDLAEEGCYAVSVGDKDYGLDYLDRPFCVDDYPKIKTAEDE